MIEKLEEQIQYWQKQVENFYTGDDVSVVLDGDEAMQIRNVISTLESTLNWMLKHA